MERGARGNGASNSYLVTSSLLRVSSARGFADPTLFDFGIASLQAHKLHFRQRPAQLSTGPLLGERSDAGRLDFSGDRREAVGARLPLDVPQLARTRATTQTDRPGHLLPKSGHRVHDRTPAPSCSRSRPTAQDRGDHPAAGITWPGATDLSKIERRRNNSGNGYHPTRWNRSLK